MLSSSSFKKGPVYNSNVNMSKVCLIVIDGWGLSDRAEGNAIINATTPVMDTFAKAGDANYCTLDASGLAVGLPDGMMGKHRLVSK